MKFYRYIVLFVFTFSAHAHNDASYVSFELNGKNYKITHEKGHKTFSDDPNKVTMSFSEPGFRKKHSIRAIKYYEDTKKSSNKKFEIGFTLYLPQPAGHYEMLGQSWNDNEQKKYYKEGNPQINFSSDLLGSNFTNGLTSVKSAERQGEFIVDYKINNKTVEGTFSAKLHKYVKPVKKPYAVDKYNYIIIKNGKFKIYR